MVTVSVSENSSSTSSSCLDGEKQWPRSQTIKPANSSYFRTSTASSKRSARSSQVEVKCSPTLSDRAKNHPWRKKSAIEVGEGSGSDRNNVIRESTDPVDCDKGSDEDKDDDDWMCNDEEYDSDDLSLDDAKKSKWLKGFFQRLDSLRKDQMEESMHCPACRGGAGGNLWYVGFHAIIKHAESIKSRRVKLHRRFAEILRGELKNRSAKSSGLDRGKSLEWKGLEEEVDDQLIVWPPIVILQNTRSHKDDTGKWIGLRREELPVNIKSYNIKNVKSAYGPNGHTGVTALVFESSGVAYVEAECLHNQFLKEGRGRHAWEYFHSRKYSSRERLLYGYLASEEDMELFNKHSKGKPNCKYEMKSYKTMVFDPLKKMRDNDSKLSLLEDKVKKEKEKYDLLNQSYQKIDEKYHAREDDIQIMRREASKNFEERETEMEYLEKFYGDRIKQLTEDLERIKMEQQQMQSTVSSSSNEP